MIYRVPEEWIAGRRRAALWAAPIMVLIGVGILAVVLWPRVNWERAQDRTAATMVSGVVVVGLLIGGLAGRFSFRVKMQRWESFSVEVTPTELVRQMDGRETRIQRDNVKSMREFSRRGFVVTDKIGWQIFVPKVIERYGEFREEILKWGAKNSTRL